VLINPLEGKTYHVYTSKAKSLEEAKREWHYTVNSFEQLIRAEGKTDEQKTQDFYHAFLRLVMWAAYVVRYERGGAVARHSFWADDDYASRVVYNATCAHMRNSLDKILFMLNYKTVLKYVELKPGQLPNPEYAKWVDPD
jgi:hypothetical protein